MTSPIVLWRGGSRAAMGRLVGVALLALLLAQWTALTHAIAHASLGAAGVVAIEDDGHWGHDAGAPACTLIDHLLLGELTGGDAPAISWLPPDAMPAAAPKCRLVCSGALWAYQARGPPGA